MWKFEVITAHHGDMCKELERRTKAGWQVVTVVIRPDAPTCATAYLKRRRKR